MNLSAIIKKYQNYIHTNHQVYFSPGRINLIGEHIDYLGGRVLPTAISLGTYAVVSKRDDDAFLFISDNFPQEPVIINKNQLAYDSNRGWVNYLVGMIESFVTKGLEIDKGLNIIIYGTLPNQAGLSSSASLEVLMGLILKDTYQFDIKMEKIVAIAQQVENHYIGVKCGIMDQFIIGMNKQKHAMFLDTHTLKYDFIPLTLGDYVIVIANTNVKRGLVDSKYNERRDECQEGLNQVQHIYKDVHNLCDTTLEQFEKIEFSSEVIQRRVKHAITENKRTEMASEALKNNDMIQFGQLLNEAHQSLKDDFEVSCLELDVLQEAFIKHDAVGARMTGAGFGGCVIAIVNQNHVDDVIQNVQAIYEANTKYSADFFVSKTSDGAKKLNHTGAFNYE